MSSGSLATFAMHMMVGCNTLYQAGYMRLEVRLAIWSELSDGVLAGVDHPIA